MKYLARLLLLIMVSLAWFGCSSKSKLQNSAIGELPGPLKIPASIKHYPIDPYYSIPNLDSYSDGQTSSIIPPGYNLQKKSKAKTKR